MPVVVLVIVMVVGVVWVGVVGVVEAAVRKLVREVEVLVVGVVEV